MPSRERGFTLIELLVVILIIGVLISIGIPTFLGIRNRGYDTRAKSLLKQAATGAAGYYDGNGETYNGLTDALLGAEVGGHVTMGTGQDEVHVVSASGTTATLSCLSGSGTTWYAHLSGTAVTIDQTP